MDVTYAEVRKPRRGGGAESGGPAPSPAPPGPDRAPSPAGSAPHAAAAYEVVTPPTPAPPAGSSAPLGFNFRVGKPRGPREPPADWPRV